MIDLLSLLESGWFRKAPPIRGSRQADGADDTESRWTELKIRRKLGDGRCLAAIVLLVALSGGCGHSGSPAAPDKEPDPEPDPPRHLVSTLAGSGGSISPSTQDVLPGDRAEFRVIADSGYRISKVSGCSGSLGDDIYLTGVITGPCTVSAQFVLLSVPAEDLIIDNGAAGTTAKGVWKSAASPYPYGPTSLSSKEAGASYTFQAQASGTHDLYLWWTQDSDRSAAVPVEIYDAGVLVETVLIDQQRNGGRWNRLGSYYFSETARIVIRSQSTQSSTCADAVRLVRIADEGPRVTLTFPAGNHLQTSPDLSATADAHYLETGWGVRFLLDAGTQSIDDYLPPFAAVFKGILRGEHIIEALVIDGQGREVAGPDARSGYIQIGVGGYYVAMGDSITLGADDDLSSDDISLDGRDRAGGFEPVLNNLLTGTRKFPHHIANEGVRGALSADGAAVVRNLLAKHPDARVFLVQYGTNDSYPSWNPVPSGLGLLPADQGYRGTYKDNLQRIIDAIRKAGKEVYLAKIPITLGEVSDGTPFADPQTVRRNQVVREYNQVVEELVLANRIAVAPPDFYGYFAGENPETGKLRYQEEFADNLHPNGLGYRSLARLWAEAMASTPSDF